jgi:hypothetical protein
MGIESRKGRLYYYEKRREGSRVVSEYVGGGVLADLAERRARIERARREAERERLRREQISMADIDREIEAASDLIDLLTKASLLTAGFHDHKRQWRRRRNG